MLFVLFGYAVFIPSYGFLFVNHLRKMEKRDKGNKVIEGWITHAYGVGERVYFTPVKFEVAERLSPDDLASVQEYVDTLKQYDEIIKIDTGLSKFKSKQITYKENFEKEIKDKEEMKEIMEEEKEELEGYEGEFKKIKVLEQKENNKKIKKEISEVDLEDGE